MPKVNVEQFICINLGSPIYMTYYTKLGPRTMKEMLFQLPNYRFANINRTPNQMLYQGILLIYLLLQKGLFRPILALSKFIFFCFSVEVGRDSTSYLTSKSSILIF
jgi:hypothetical protein